MRTSAPGDCPLCRSAGSLTHGYCAVCGEEIVEAADLPPAASPFGLPETVRFVDVLRELDQLAGLAASIPLAAGAHAAELARRAGRLLAALRGQFLQEVVIGSRGSLSPPPRMPAAR